MLYPQKGSIAIGSRRSCPTLPAAAAVVSLPAVAPRNVPCCQLNASVTSGCRAPLREQAIGSEPFGLAVSAQDNTVYVTSTFQAGSMSAMAG